MCLDLSDGVALSSALVAVLSAIYARRSAAEARRSNEISLLKHRREIYDAFFELKMHMQHQGESADLSEVSKFYYPSRNARIFLSSELSQKISKYYEACFGIAQIYLRSNGRMGENMDKCGPYLEAEKKLALEIEEDLLELIQVTNA